MFKYTGFHVIKIRYTLLSILVVLFAVLLLAYFYLTSLIETRTINAMTWALETKVIAIDPGHGGYDPGARGPSGSQEKDINLQISEKLAKKLSNDGALVLLLRDEDKDFLTEGPGTKKQRDLDNRLKIIKEHNAEILVSIHVNSFGTNWSGAQTFYNPKNPKNEILAKFIQDELVKDTPTNRKILTNTTSYLLENLDIPACIVEVGFLSNPKEEKRLLDPTYQDTLANAIYKGILKYLASQ